jgi:hypothetical protein
MLRQFGGLPTMPAGQAVGTSRLQFGGVPTMPAGHFTGIGRLQFGHWPIMPRGQCCSILRQLGHCPTVPGGQCSTGPQRWPFQFNPAGQQWPSLHVCPSRQTGGGGGGGVNGRHSLPTRRSSAQ